MRSRKETQIRRRKFLVAYARLGCRVKAAKVAGVERSSHYRWLADPEYRASYEAAHREFLDRLEGVIAERAMRGVRKLALYKGQPVFVWKDKQGEVVPANTAGAKRCAVYETTYSDVLAIFRAKGEMPDKYAERAKVAHTGPNGGPIEVIETVVQTREQAVDLLSRLPSTN